MITCNSNPQLVLTHVDTTAIADVNTNVDISTNTIVDMSTTRNYFTLESPCQNKKLARAPLSIRIPNGQTLRSTHTVLLKEKSSPFKAR